MAGGAPSAPQPRVRFTSAGNRAEEQAAAIAFLASDEASYINGVSLDVNGGLYLAGGRPSVAFAV